MRRRNLQGSPVLDEKVDIEKEFLTKGIIQIILTFFGIGLSLDMKGFFFYGAIFGGISLLVVGIMNISSYQKSKPNRTVIEQTILGYVFATKRTKLLLLSIAFVTVSIYLWSFDFRGLKPWEY